ncbi:MAG: hypothetical protein IK024_10895 [Treponema sp.]|nr:hypothetical protein [Treponema sp.]
MHHYNLEQALDEIIMNKYSSFKNIAIRDIKENDNYYVIYLKFKIMPIGLPASYKLNKKTGALDAIYLPDEDNFNFLDYFENCKSIEIPSKFVNKWF